MKILCVIDTRNKVHENRVNVLRRLFVEFSFDIHVAGSKISNAGKYDIVYFLSHGLYSKNKIKHSNLLCSITSHKSIDEYNKTKAILKSFKKISVNNLLLFNYFKSFNVQYIPNGVDINLFKKKNITYKQGKPIFGWVGNTDRKTKNFNIINHLKNKINIHTIETQKGGTTKPIQKVIEFYNGIDFYLVVSSTEGTPNPALEAASCGIPVISTRVGNMNELIIDRINGFFVGIDEKSILNKINSIKNMSVEEYNTMSTHIAEDIRKNWAWEHRINDYREFFYVH